METTLPLPADLHFSLKAGWMANHQHDIKKMKNAQCVSLWRGRFFESFQATQKANHTATRTKTQTEALWKPVLCCCPAESPKEEREINKIQIKYNRIYYLFEKCFQTHLLFLIQILFLRTPVLVSEVFKKGN